ncbi:hypothetical protein ARAM_003200 [Aspergillus rambellii]|uniref:Uncharacterized protein n=1 Tax=Aspergillus rambellii TaxID=308745 RepID=A0A0F8WND3_9EURO|nr:hypothetical protein ARAM_003200 [Aspergillus rambellii]
MFWHLVFLTLVGLLPGVSAISAGSDWEDFSNNLATDLAPLISLFGERLTKQFLSESTGLLDNIIFALSPLGILTALVSVIRVCGSPSLRALIGRAQEAPGEAENELLSCVSETTAELFNDGGISRVLGRPRILEVVVWEEPDPSGQGVCRRMGTLRDALLENAWVVRKGQWILDEKGLLPELDIPNLSLNKGIKQRGPAWFYSAALLGVVLQTGPLVYAGLTVFLWPALFTDQGSFVQGYAFPLYVYGTVSLCTGMFLCAFMIERSSAQCHIYPAKPSKIYWLQPGRQKIGEQDFGAFLAVNEGPNSQATEDLTYIKSVQNVALKERGLLLLFTIFITITGFVLQFVSLRGLHPSVILANLGSMLVMSIVRTCLRVERIGSGGNSFCTEDKELISHKQQELDCFALHLEKVKYFRLMSSFVHESNRSRSGSWATGSSTQNSLQVPGLGSKLVQTRTQLAKLTSRGFRHSSMDWNDLPIRKIAQDLARTLGMTMDVVSTWKGNPSDFYSFELSFLCQYNHKSAGSALETYAIKLERLEDTLQWKVDANELEAVLGLWTLSLLKQDSKWLQNGLGRLVGLTKAEARSEAADLYFHKWIFRQREARMVSSKMIPFSEQIFGYYSDEYLGHKEILVVKTDNKLEVMAAQDIYIQFLMSILAGLKSIGGDVDILPRSQSDFYAQSTSLDVLVNCFESGNLGSREDALLCIVPVLRHRKLLPELAADSSSVRKRVQDLLSAGNWEGAFSIIQWLCERCEGEEFERSVYELGLLCQRAMLYRDAAIRTLGFQTVSSLLKSDIRAKKFSDLRSARPSDWMYSPDQRDWWVKFSNQLGWVAWHIANNRVDGNDTKKLLESWGYPKALSWQANLTYADSCIDQETAQKLLVGYLLPKIDKEFHEISQGGIEIEWGTFLEWVFQNGHSALTYWILANCADISQDYPHMAMEAFVFAAKKGSDSAILTLRRHGADINSSGLNENCTALVRLVATNDKKGSEMLLVHGADVNECNGHYALEYAAEQGNEEILLLLLQHGADMELRDYAGFTALHIACKDNCLNTAKLLMAKGADIETIAGDGRTPLISAAMECHLEVLELLLEKGARVNARGNDGRTALTHAVEAGSEEIVRLLRSYNAEVYHINPFERSLLEQAKESGSTEIVKLLNEAM